MCNVYLRRASTPRIILFICVLMRVPVIHENILVFFRKLQRHLVFAVTVRPS